VRVGMIACPVDFSDCSKRALRHAGALASHFGSTLGLLHVVDPMLAGAAAIHQYDLFGDEARADLRRFAVSAIDLPATSDLTIVQGSPAPEIVEYASHREADLIVMGTHGLTGVRKVLFGSTASRVLRESGVPVLAVPPAGSGHEDSDTPFRGPGPIVAPVDFSAESEAAAFLAADVARELSRPLLLLHSVDRHAKPAAGSGNDAVSVAEAVLHRLADSIGGDPDVCVVEGVPAQEIARCALEREAILIVMALTGTNQQPRPGSVAYRVLSMAPVPVLAAPPIVARRQVAACECRSAVPCC